MKRAANLFVLAMLCPLVVLTAACVWTVYYRSWRRKALVERRWAATLAWMDVKADLRELWR